MDEEAAESPEESPASKAPRHRAPSHIILALSAARKFGHAVHRGAHAREAQTRVHPSAHRIPSMMSGSERRARIRDAGSDVVSGSGGDQGPDCHTRQAKAHPPRPAALLPRSCGSTPQEETGCLGSSPDAAQLRKGIHQQRRGALYPPRLQLNVLHACAKDNDAMPLRVGEMRTPNQEQHPTNRAAAARSHRLLSS